jgi:hypothetical protein
VDVTPADSSCKRSASLVESEWGLLDRPFQIGDAVWVLYPGALRKRLKRKGPLTVDRMKLAADALDRALPPAGR